MVERVMRKSSAAFMSVADMGREIMSLVQRTSSLESGKVGWMTFIVVNGSIFLFLVGILLQMQADISANTALLEEILQRLPAR